jgi:hypothetical protein
MLIFFSTYLKKAVFGCIKFAKDLLASVDIISNKIFLKPKHLASLKFVLLETSGTLKLSIFDCLRFV